MVRIGWQEAAPSGDGNAEVDWAIAWTLELGTLVFSPMKASSPTTPSSGARGPSWAAVGDPTSCVARKPYSTT